VAETFLSMTYSQNFSDRFSAGFTGKLISDQLGSTKATGFAVDFGTNFHAMIGERPIRAAFVIQNLGSNLRHDGSALECTTTSTTCSGGRRTPPLGTVDIPQELQPVRLRTSSWGLPVQFRVGVSLDLLSAGMNRVSVLGEFTQPVNTKPGAGAGLEWALTNVGNSGFSLAARGSYTLQPDNKLQPPEDAAGNPLAGFPTTQSTSSFSKDGLALGGGLAYGRGNWRVGFDYAYRDLGILGATNFVSFSVSW
jgi:hypothetical protein